MFLNRGHDGVKPLREGGTSHPVESGFRCDYFYHYEASTGRLSSDHLHISDRNYVRQKVSFPNSHTSASFTPDRENDEANRYRSDS